MKTFLCTFLLLWQAAATSPSQPPQPKDFRYLRTISAPAAGQSCVMLDPSAYAHSGTALKDLRIYPADQAAGTREVPYAVTLSEPVEPDTEQADVMNLGMKGQAVSFDLAMPARPYTEVTLDLDGQDFLATATVWGKSGSNAPQATRLGEFTLFDLTSQRLARNTTLAFQESTFPYLHVEMTVSPATAASAFRATPQMVNGATVPPSRDAQAVYTLAAETSELTQKGRQTIAKFTVPERVPVERVSFVLAPEFKANFSRDVDITSRPAELAGHPQNDSKAAPLYNSESVSGTILRVHLIQAGREVRQQELSIPATLGSNLQG
ncbi:MAG: hypothetical protein FWD64_05565, partial [Acidobacteriaceae bacterium]|nr:hypothetical protein [Acidobacteriaceae bacterium]